MCSLHSKVPLPYHSRPHFLMFKVNWFRLKTVKSGQNPLRPTDQSQGHSGWPWDDWEPSTFFSQRSHGCREVKLCSHPLRRRPAGHARWRPPGSSSALCPPADECPQAASDPDDLSAQPITNLLCAPHLQLRPCGVPRVPHHWNPNSLTQERQRRGRNLKRTEGSLASTGSRPPAICVDTVTVRLAFRPSPLCSSLAPHPDTPRLPRSLGWSRRPPWNGLWSVSAFLRVSYGFQHVSSLPRQQKGKNT